MRRLTAGLIGLMVAVLAVMLVFPALAQAQTSIPVVIDTTKLTVQLPVSQTVKGADGVWYQISGTLTVKPVPAPNTAGETPSAFAPLVRNRALTETTLTLTGRGFGETPGAILVNYLEVPALQWDDRAIVADISGARRPVGSYSVKLAGEDTWTAGAVLPWDRESLPDPVAAMIPAEGVPGG